MTIRLIGDDPVQHPHSTNQKWREICSLERWRYYKRNTATQLLCAKTRISVWNRLLITLHNKGPAWGDTGGMFTYLSGDLLWIINIELIGLYHPFSYTCCQIRFENCTFTVKLSRQMIDGKLLHISFVYESKKYIYWKYMIDFFMRRSSIQLTFSQMLEDFSLMYNIQTLDVHM